MLKKFDQFIKDHGDETAYFIMFILTLWFIFE